MAEHVDNHELLSKVVFSMMNQAKTVFMSYSNFYKIVNKNWQNFS